MPNAITDAITALAPIAYFKCSVATEAGSRKPTENLAGANCVFQYSEDMVYISVITATAGQLTALAECCETWNGVMP